MKEQLDNEFSISGRILEYEAGLLELEEIIELFQSLMDSGYLSVMTEDYLSVFDRFCILGDIKGHSKLDPTWRYNVLRSQG